MNYEEKIEVEEIGTITLRRKFNVSTISIRIKSPTEIIYTIPFYVPHRLAIKTLLENKQKVLNSIEKLKHSNKITLPTDPAELKKLIEQAKKQLPEELQALATRHNLQYNKVVIKNNKSNWGSCSLKKNINLNLKLLFLPPHLREYVMLHELAHLKHLNHSPEFHTLLDQMCNGNSRALAKELKTWRNG